MPLRILHVVPYGPDAWAYGGIPRVVAAQTRELARRGHRVTLCTTDARSRDGRLPRPDAGRPLAPWPPFCTIDGVDVRVFPNFSNRLAYYYQSYIPLGLRQFFRSHAKDFDVAHLHACRNLPGVFAATRLQHAHVPYVLQPNGTAPRLERLHTAKRLFDAASGDRVMRGAASVIAVSDAERRQFAQLDVRPVRVDRIANPIDLDEFSATPPRGRFRARLQLDPSVPLVMFLGKLTPRKRVDVLLRAWPLATTAGAQLVIAGNDMGAEPALRALVRSLGIEARVTFTGLLTGRERLDALTDADVVVYPSEHEIFGLVAIEALLCGTPVVVSNDSGCGEVIETTGGGVVVPVGDAAGIARAIDAMLGERGLWRDHARDAGARVRDLFDGRTIARQLEDVYASILGQSRAAA